MARTSVKQRRLLFWLLLALGFLLVNFHRTATAVLSDALTGTFDTSGAELGFLHASFFYIYAILQLPAGVVADRYGSRWVGGIGLGVMAGGIFLFGLSESFLIALLARGLIGLGGSVLYVATLRFCANWFQPDEFATMSGLTVASSGVGGIIATTPLALSLEYVSWQTAVFVSGGFGILIALSIVVFVRDQPPDGDGQTSSQSRKTSSFSTVIPNTRTVLMELETWLLGMMLFFIIGTNFTVLGLWGVPFIADLYDKSITVASIFVLLGNIGLVFGSPVLGYISDRLNRRTEIIVGSCGLFSILYSLLLFIPPLFVVAAVFFLVMFMNGGAVLAYTVGKERHGSDVGGTITGVINSIGYVGAAIFPPIMGVVLDAYWTGALIDGSRVYSVTGYRVAFGIAALSGALATGLALWLHLRQRGQATDA